MHTDHAKEQTEQEAKSNNKNGYSEEENLSQVGQGWRCRKTSRHHSKIRSLFEKNAYFKRLKSHS